MYKSAFKILLQDNLDVHWAMFTPPYSWLSCVGNCPESDWKFSTSFFSGLSGIFVSCSSFTDSLMDGMDEDRSFGPSIESPLPVREPRSLGKLLKVWGDGAARRRCMYNSISSSDGESLELLSTSRSSAVTSHSGSSVEARDPLSAAHESLPHRDDSESAFDWPLARCNL